MRHMRIVEIPATQREEESHRTCDICGNRMEETTRAYDIDEVEVRHRSGVNYPEEDYAKTTYFDLCGKCFDEKLIPALCALGAEPRVEDANGNEL